MTTDDNKRQSSMRNRSGCIGSGWNSLLQATLVMAIISPAMASTSSTGTNGSARWLPAIVTATLTADLSGRIENHCYEGGHITYRDDTARPQFLGGLSHFIARTVAAQSSSEAHK
jgi:hypothetical protein